MKYSDTPVYDGEVEISFDDLYERAEEDWRETCRAELPGTVEYDFKREADKLAQESGETWMNAEEREEFRRVFQTITFDNGGEFSDVERLERSAIRKKIKRTKVYFCHPYSSYERGSNECQKK